MNIFFFAGMYVKEKKSKMFLHVTGHLEVSPHKARRYLSSTGSCRSSPPPSLERGSDHSECCISGDSRKGLWSAYIEIVEPLRPDPWVVQYMMYLRDHCSHSPEILVHRFSGTSLDIACCTFAVKVVQGVDGDQMPSMEACKEVISRHAAASALCQQQQKGKELSTAAVDRSEVTRIELMLMLDPAAALDNIPLFKESPRHVDWATAPEHNIPNLWLIHFLDMHYGQRCHCECDASEVVRWAVSKVMSMFPFVVTCSSQ